MTSRSVRLAVITSTLLAAVLVATAQQQPPPNPNRPTLFVIGDLPFASIQSVFDPNTIKLVESPAKGQTTRTYLNSGAWGQLTAQIKSGDFVLIGFKPNTDASVNKLSSDPTAAATQTLKTGDGDTFDYMDPDTHKLEQIHLYSWYLHKFIEDSLNRGANPILCYPPTPIDPATQFPGNRYLAYPAWIIKAMATSLQIPYLDLTTTTFTTALQTLKPDPLDPYLRHPTP